jgi:hypothetical protein
LWRKSALISALIEVPPRIARRFFLGPLRIPSAPCSSGGQPFDRSLGQPILKLLACSDDGATLTKSIEPLVPSESSLPPEWSLVSAENACEAVVYPPTPLSRLMIPVGS